MSGSIEEFPSVPRQERDIRQNSLGYGALVVAGEVVQYTVVPDEWGLTDDRDAVRYDDQMVLLGPSVPTRPKFDAEGRELVELTQTGVVRSFIRQEKASADWQDVHTLRRQAA